MVNLQILIPSLPSSGHLLHGQFPVKTNAYVSTLKVHHHMTPGSSIYMAVNMTVYLVAKSMDTVIRARSLRKRAVSILKDQDIGWEAGGEANDSYGE